jgi:transposase
VSRSSKFPEQFRKDAVELVRSSDRPLRQVARELGVNHETLRNWVRTAERAEAAAQQGGVSSGVSASEQEELRALRKRVAELELEKEILRKAAAYFAKEMGR